MCDLDGARSRHRVAIERQQPVRSEQLQRFVERRGIRLRSHELWSGDPTTKISNGIVDGHHPKEGLLDGTLCARGQRVVELLGSTRQRAIDAPERLIARKAEHAPCRVLGQLGHGVLQQREPTRLVIEIADDAIDQSWLELEPDGSSGLGDGRGQTIAVGQCDRHEPRLHQCPELWVLQRTIEEVGPHRQDDTQARSRVDHRVHDAVEEQRRDIVVGRHREKLLELIDDQQQFGLSVGQDLLEDAQQSPVVTDQIGDDALPIHPHP